MPDRAVIRLLSRQVEWRVVTHRSSKFDMHENFSGARIGK